jgi:hypothetical protein
MFYLGNDFIFASLLWLFLLSGFVYTFRKPIAKLFFKKESLDLFISKLKTYTKKTYPDIKFDYSMIELSKSEQNPTTRKYDIADDILTQFKKLKLDKNRFPKTTSKDLQWQGYIFNSEPNKDKLPKDWAKRKNALFLRENRKCFRCSKYIDINTLQIRLIRSLENGGKYHLENLIPVCKDCDKILTNDPKKRDKLQIKDDLNHIVQNS